MDPLSKYFGDVDRCSSPEIRALEDQHDKLPDAELPKYTVEYQRPRSNSIRSKTVLPVVAAVSMASLNFGEGPKAKAYDIKGKRKVSYRRPGSFQNMLSMVSSRVKAASGFGRSASPSSERAASAPIPGQELRGKPPYARSSSAPVTCDEQVVSSHRFEQANRSTSPLSSPSVSPPPMYQQGVDAEVKSTANGRPVESNPFGGLSRSRRHVQEVAIDEKAARNEKIRAANPRRLLLTPNPNSPPKRVVTQRPKSAGSCKFISVDKFKTGLAAVKEKIELQTHAE